MICNTMYSIAICKTTYSLLFVTMCCYFVKFLQVVVEGGEAVAPGMMESTDTIMMILIFPKPQLVELLLVEVDVLIPMVLLYHVMVMEWMMV